MNKVTKESIEARIKETTYHRVGDKTTICKITMVNGFEVLGQSACVDPKNFDQKLGEKYSYENAFEKLWELEGYLLQEKLYREPNQNSKISKSIFQNPMIPEECSKVFSQGTSYENKVEQKPCTCMDWDKFPHVKKMMFMQMFPDSPNFAFDLADGKIKMEGTIPSGVEAKGFAIGSEEDKVSLFQFLFPKAEPEDYRRLVLGSYTPTEPEAQNNDYHIRLTKQYRKDLDATLQSIKSSRRQSRERSLAITKIQEAILWLGMDLKELGSVNPYPTSYDPNTTTVEPTAD